MFRYSLDVVDWAAVIFVLELRVKFVLVMFNVFVEVEEPPLDHQSAHSFVNGQQPITRHCISPITMEAVPRS